MLEHWSVPTSGMTGAGTEEAISPSLMFPDGSVLGKEPDGRTGDWEEWLLLSIVAELAADTEG